MKKRYFIFSVISISLFVFISCEKFFEPEMSLIVETQNYYKDWSEYRAAEMGIYSLQQKLVDQIVVLGELRADLLDITSNAEKDLIEVYNFQISKENKYASPINFYRLIGACNSMIRQLETAHPEVLDKTAEPTTYDRLFGEVLCMRAWAYFNAVKIYGKVPYVWQSLTTVDEITEYVNSPSTIIDTLHVIYSPDGYYNDTIRNDTVVLTSLFLDMRAVIDTFTWQLEKKVKEVGVIHNMENNDLTWDVTVWNRYAWHCLLGQMYLYEGNLAKAHSHFYPIMFNYESETSDIKFGLDSRFAEGKWKNIFTGIDPYEHIYTIWFGKSYQQQHYLQYLFSNIFPNSYQLKPSGIAVRNWETIWNGMDYGINPTNPSLMTMDNLGIPGDFYRGYGISYVYYKDDVMLEPYEVREMLRLKSKGLSIEYQEIMEDVDTVVNKFTYGKTSYDQDANFIIYRAASIHLYFAEIFARWYFDHSGVIRPEVNTALNILNNGTYNNEIKQKGVRGRVGFGDGDDAVKVGNIIYRHDPYTNEIIGYYDYTDNLLAKQEYLEDKIIEERARELAFEGERFYDLMRIAKRRNDPSYLADKVAAKFKGARAEEIRQYLMDENNWYITFY